MTDDGGNGDWPSWSPDGSQLTLNTDRDGNAEIYIMKADGSGAYNVSQSSGSTGGLGDWSPNGRKLIFYSNRSGNRDVYTLDLTTSTWSNISSHPASDEFCVWSPCVVRSKPTRNTCDSRRAVSNLDQDSGEPGALDTRA